MQPPTLAPRSVSASAVSFDDVVAVARDGAGVRLGDDAVAAIERSRRVVVEELAAAPTPAYGISTGFGALATRHIPAEKRAQLQRSLVRSHAAGNGPEVEREVTRALMLLRLSTLATGHTGIRPQTAQLLADLLSHGITPVVHEYGSLGCSGDLAPLSHCALALMGEGPVRRADGSLIDAATALAEAGLDARRAGRQGGAGPHQRHRRHARHARARAARPAQPARPSPTWPPRCRSRPSSAPTGCSPRTCRRSAPHPGQAASAATSGGCWPTPASWRATAAPTATASRTPTRCAARRRCTAPSATPATTPRASPSRELASAIDNPVVVDGRVESNGNFHGAPVGYVLDFLAIAVADLASISERRTDRFLDRSRNHGLPPFLADDPGVDSGHMIAQYTQAAIVSELKRLAIPASVDSIPSSAMQEDHVSMGWSAARKLRRSVDGLTRVLAVEVLTAARALDLRAPLEPSPGHRRRRSGCSVEHVPGPGPGPPPRARDRSHRRTSSPPAPSVPPSKKRSETSHDRPNPRLPIHARHRHARSPRGRGRPRRRCGCS